MWGKGEYTMKFRDKARKEKVENPVLLIAWAIRHDSHGLLLDTVCWTPDGEAPETNEDWVRIPFMDGAWENKYA